MRSHRNRQTTCRGGVADNGHGKKFPECPRVAISFDRSLFERISGEAARRKVPFAVVVRERLVEAYLADTPTKFDQEAAIASLLDDSRSTIRAEDAR